MLDHPCYIIQQPHQGLLDQYRYVRFWWYCGYYSLLLPTIQIRIYTNMLLELNLFLVWSCRYQFSGGAVYWQVPWWEEYSIKQVLPYSVAHTFGTYSWGTQDQIWLNLSSSFFNLMLFTNVELYKILIFLTWYFLCRIIQILFSYWPISS